MMTRKDKENKKNLFRLIFLLMCKTECVEQQVKNLLYLWRSLVVINILKS